MTVLPAGYGKNQIYQMFVLAKRYELNGKASILIIPSLKSVLERTGAGDRITGLSFCRLLQFSSVIRRCEFKILAYLPPPHSTWPKQF